MPRLMGYLNAVVALLGAADCRAADSSAGVVLPPLTAAARTASPQPREAVVRLDGDQVLVRFTLRPSLQRRSAARRLAMVWPAYGWLGEGEPYPVRHAPDLQVSVDGQPAALDNLVEAFADGKRSITTLLASASIDPWLITETPPMLRVPANEGAALVQAGAVAAADGDFLARWTAARRLSFEIPAGAAALTLAYTAMPGFVLVGTGELPPPPMLRDACAAPRQLKNLLQDSAWVARIYTVPVGLAGSNPAKVRLQLTRPGTPRAVIAVCTPRGGRLLPAAQSATPLAVTARHGAVRILVLDPVAYRYD